MRPRKNFKKLLKSYGVNVKLILGKLRGNIRVILYYWYYGNYKEISKIFLWNCEENFKKRGEYFVQIFYYFDENFVTFSCQFSEKLIKNYWKNMKNTL